MGRPKASSLRVCWSEKRHGRTSRGAPPPQEPHHAHQAARRCPGRAPTSPSATAQHRETAESDVASGTSRPYRAEAQVANEMRPERTPRGREVHSAPARAKMQPGAVERRPKPEPRSKSTSSATAPVSTWNAVVRKAAARPASGLAMRNCPSPRVENWLALITRTAPP